MAPLESALPQSTDPDSEEPAASAAQAEGAQMRRAARGALIETAGYTASLAVRFGSNLILTRLLYPEVFGLMAMVHLLLYSLAMLSDVGLNQAVIAHPKGDDDDFLNTAWSIQVVRGASLMVAMWFLTWPAALWFKEPQMLWIVPFASVNLFIHGFYSSRVFTCARHVRVAPLLKMELTTQILAVGLNVLGAYLGYGIKSLLFSQLVSMIICAIWTHFLPGTNHRDRWNMDPVLRKEILSFGRWIFLSSALTVFATRGDSGLLGRLLGAASLGLYNLASSLADMPEALAVRLTNSVIYPTLSRTFNQQPGEFSRVFYKLRLYYDSLGHTALGGFAALAGWIIKLLYDERYHEAGDMLAIFALRASISLLAMPWESAFFARGHTHFGFRRNLLGSIAVMTAMPIGFHYFGPPGVLWGTVVARATGLLVFWPAARREGLLRVHRELLAPVFFAVGYGLGSAVSWLIERLVSP